MEKALKKVRLRITLFLHWLGTQETVSSYVPLLFLYSREREQRGFGLDWGFLHFTFYFQSQEIRLDKTMWLCMSHRLRTTGIKHMSVMQN